MKTYLTFLMKLLSMLNGITNRFILGVREQLTLPVRLWHKIKYRRIIALSNTASNPADAMEWQNGLKTYYLETGALNASLFLLAKQGSTGANYVDICGASDLPIGTICDTGATVGTGTNPDVCQVHLLGKGSTSRMVANGVIAAGVNVYAAASGKIASTGTQIVGVSISAAGADGDVIAVNDMPVFPAPGVAASLYDANTILYATTDNTPVALTVGASSIVGRAASGNIVALTGTQARVIEGITGVITISVSLASITTNMDVLTLFVLPGAMTINGIDAYAKVAVTTGSKLTTLSTFINTTVITGGVLSLTSANLTPLGVKVAGSAVTAANVAAAGDTITIKSTSTTAFSEGEIILAIRYTLA